jgi:hypothetical protein
MWRFVVGLLFPTFRKIVKNFYYRFVIAALIEPELVVWRLALGVDVYWVYTTFREFALCPSSYDELSFH